MTNDETKRMKKTPNAQRRTPNVEGRRAPRDVSELFTAHLIADLYSLRTRAEQLNSWFKNIKFLMTSVSLRSAIDHLDEAVKRAGDGYVFLRNRKSQHGKNLRKSAKSVDKKSGGAR